MKKQAVRIFATAVCVLAVIACNKQNSDKITVVSREEGSGTRSAFVELFGVLDNDKKDIITLNAEITNNTAVMISSVQTNSKAIGYISMGSMNDAVKAINIGGVKATAENVMKGAYPISRPFIIATKENISEVANDFIMFIMSSSGQEIVKKSGYISINESDVYVSSNIGGKIVVAGSSSVSPLMEKLKEAYLAVNPAASVEIQTSDSSTGLKAVENDICDIGMSSRELKSSELYSGMLKPKTIAIDGLAVIVNNENSVYNLTKEQVKSIFTGEILNWKEVK